MIRAAILSATFLSLAWAVPLSARPATRHHHVRPVHLSEAPVTRVTNANRAATREPSQAGYVNAVQVYPYAEGTLYRLYAAPEHEAAQGGF